MTVEEAAAIARWCDGDVEQEVLECISLDVPWSLTERFSTLVRTSGSAEERQAVELIRDRLKEWGIPHELHEPVCFISVPLSASVEAAGTMYRAKTAAMSVSTDDNPVTGELVYIPESGQAGTHSVFSAGVSMAGVDVAGKIVVTEGFASPGKVADVMRAGAIAGIFINPGENIHEGICTTIWGAPDLDSIERLPTIPVVAVNKADGLTLIELAREGATANVSTKLDTGWRKIPVLVAEIPGTQLSEEFVLLHGHLDSWHVGIGDNATGNATMLELARVFWEQRESLSRSLRIAWWSGHSHGRYAGSTWYSDTFAIDLAHHCVAQVNCDSPGCRWTETYNELSAMSETESFIETVIPQVTGITPVPERPPRAGDYSFNDIGLSSLYMLSSTMSPEARTDRGYYAVGGCGGNIAWHTEDDTLEIADRAMLLRDMRMYGASVLRLLNAPLHPFDWTRATEEFAETLERYQQAASDDFDFEPARVALARLQGALDRFYASAPRDESIGGEAIGKFNWTQRRLARILIPVNYSRTQQFFHDPALNVPPLPDLVPALAMEQVSVVLGDRRILQTHLTRGQNRLVWALDQASELVERAVDG
jgi:N-acetylated-alpha-linked acidic dipeptidase